LGAGPEEEPALQKDIDYVVKLCCVLRNLRSGCVEHEGFGSLAHRRPASYSLLGQPFLLMYGLGRLSNLGAGIPGSSG
jgi:hypothetical protein